MNDANKLAALRKRAETILSMTVDATNALNVDETDIDASAVADGLYLDIIASCVKSLSQVVAERES